MEEALFLSAMESFRHEYGSFPSGNSAEILKVLVGDNPKKICFLSLETHSKNQFGQYIDPWQIPFRIILTPTNITIQSAGKNGVFGDADDISMTSTNLF